MIVPLYMQQNIHLLSMFALVLLTLALIILFVGYFISFSDLKKPLIYVIIAEFVFAVLFCVTQGGIQCSM